MTQHRTAPLFILMGGLPASGKSFIREAMVLPNDRPVAVISTDDVLERIMHKHDLDYREAWDRYFKAAVRISRWDLQRAQRLKHHILMDRTVLTAEERQETLAEVGGAYKAVMCWVHCPEALRQKRLLQRGSKIIPADVDADMRRLLQEPSEAEGFARVYKLDGSQDRPPLRLDQLVKSAKASQKLNFS